MEKGKGKEKGGICGKKENAKEFSQGFPKLSQTFIPIPLLPQIWPCKIQNFQRGLNDKKLGSMRSFLRLESREHVPSA